MWLSSPVAHKHTYTCTCTHIQGFWPACVRTCPFLPQNRLMYAETFLIIVTIIPVHRPEHLPAPPGHITLPFLHFTASPQSGHLLREELILKACWKVRAHECACVCERTHAQVSCFIDVYLSGLKEETSHRYLTRG